MPVCVRHDAGAKARRPDRAVQQRVVPESTPAEIPLGTLCAGGLQKGGTKILPCHNGRGGSTAVATVIRATDGQPVCMSHSAGALAIRPGGAFNDNGKVQFIYLRMDGDSRWKVGRSSNPWARDLPGTIVGDPIAIAQCQVAPNAIAAEAVEHATRLLLAQRLAGRLGISTKEWIHVDGLPAREVEQLFHATLNEVLELLAIDRNS